MIALTVSRDDATRLIFALQAYHGALSDALNARHKANPADSGLPILRQGMADTERQLADLERRLAS